MDVEQDPMKTKGAHDGKGPPTHAGGQLELQSQSKFVKEQLSYKMKYSLAF